jgi:hypothetical protein
MSASITAKRRGTALSPKGRLSQTPLALTVVAVSVVLVIGALPRCRPEFGGARSMCGAGVSDLRSDVALEVQSLPAPGVPRFAPPPRPRSLTRAGRSGTRTLTAERQRGSTGRGRSLAAAHDLARRRAAGGHHGEGAAVPLECVVTAARAVGHLSGAETGMEWPMATASLPVARPDRPGIHPNPRPRTPDSGHHRL